MYTILEDIPKYLTISVRHLINRGGHTYYHPFIGKYALSRRLEGVLKSEYNLSLRDGDEIPLKFFKKYHLIKVVTDDSIEEKFVTSDFWYTCKENDYVSSSYKSIKASLLLSSYKKNNYYSNDYSEDYFDDYSDYDTGCGEGYSCSECDNYGCSANPFN